MDPQSRRSGPPGLKRAGCARVVTRSSDTAGVAVHPVAHRFSLDTPAPRGGPAVEIVDSPPDDAWDQATPTDAELIDSVRTGDLHAFGVLYVRYLASAHTLARTLTRSPADADDYVAEAFARVLAMLRRGEGPDSAFRQYVLTALRHVAYDKTHRERNVQLAGEVGEVSGVRAELVSVPFTDTAVAKLERRFAAQAFCRLPHRWQAVLWHTEIEGRRPVEVASVLGLSPNGVSALAYRARAGLCTAYLQAQVNDTDTATSCRATTDRLGPWARRELGTGELRQVRAHLDTCTNCRRRVRELAENNPRLFRQ